MSRIGNAPITVPGGVTVTINGQDVHVKGAKGELNTTIPTPISVTQDGDIITVARPDEDKRSRQLHGLSRTLVNNMIVGVTEGYTTKMEIFGVGYRVQLKGKNLEFSLGFSHPVIIEPPAGVSFAVDGTNKLSVSGIDKQVVGQVAAKIRRLRKDDPYKGKGIRYEGEQVRRKVGKTGK